MQAANGLIRSLIVKNAGIMSRAYGGSNVNHRVPSYNDLPVPEGDWQEAYQQQQSKYNAQLAGSFLFLAGIIAYMKQSNVVDFNWSPPKTYE